MSQIELPVLIRCLKIIGVQNQLPITFVSLVCTKILKVRNSPHTPTTFDILLRSKSEPMVIQK